MLNYMQKINLIYYFFLRYYSLKNLAICLAESILVHNLRTRILPDKGFGVKYKLKFFFFLDYFKKCRKHLFWSILDPKLFWENNSPRNSALSSFFQFCLSITDPNLRKAKKDNGWIPSNTGFRRTHRRITMNLQETSD